MRLLYKISIAAALSVFAVPIAHACSVASDYRVPTNLELAEKAQAVFIGRVEGARAATAMPDNAIQIKVLKTLKGNVQQPVIELPGLSLAEDRFLILSNPYEFSEAHPLAYIGGCIRYMFPLGTTALFFVELDEKGAWRPAAFPFSRWAEDVSGIEAPWVRLATIYIQAATLEATERSPFLMTERDRLRQVVDDPVARLMAADIDRQLRGPNRPWNAIMEDQMKAMGFGDSDTATRGKRKK